MDRVQIALMGSFDDEGRVCVMPEYLNALWAAGAVGTLLPYREDKRFLREIADRFDGFMFCGGDDIDPILYGEENKGKSKNIRSNRDSFELAVFDEILPSEKPILAICRGLQILNVYLGGTLYQHIDNHSQTAPKNVREQKTILQKGTLLEKIIGNEEIWTNSFHHQNIKRLGTGLVADAKSHDGYIEAVHLEGHRFCLGVQWHPESYFDEDESSSKIFSEFVKACTPLDTKIETRKNDI